MELATAMALLMLTTIPYSGEATESIAISSAELTCKESESNQDQDGQQ